MQAYKTASRIDAQGELHLSHLPFQEGEEVEVILLRREAARPADPYPLRGISISYERPEDPVAEEDWEVLR